MLISVRPAAVFLAFSMAVSPSLAAEREDPLRFFQGKTESVGTVKMYKADKGFGFVGQANGGKDVFVHISAVQASGLPGLEDGQKVTFDTEPDKRGKGPKAVNLSVG